MLLNLLNVSSLLLSCHVGGRQSRFWTLWIAAGLLHKIELAVALLADAPSRPVPNVGCDSLVCLNVQLSLRGPTASVADT